MDSKINEELRQYKLFKIEETESKLKRFRKIYTEIKQHFIVTFSKNASSNIFRLVLGIISFVLIILGVLCFFPEQFINLIESEGEQLTHFEKNEITDNFYILNYFFIGFGILLWFVSLLLKKNNKKRNTIHSLSKLLEEIMAYMESASEEEKRKYEYFVDSIAEKKQLKNNTTNTNTEET